MSSHKCGTPIKKLTRSNKSTKNSVNVKIAIKEAVTDQKTGKRYSSSHTYRPQDTHLNIEVLPEGVTNADELVKWYDDAIADYEANYTIQRRVHDKKTGGFKKNPDGTDYYKTVKATVRKDACFGFSGIIKPPCVVIEELSYEEQLQYFYDALEIINDILKTGDRNCSISSFQIHFDEGLKQGEPHCHYQGLAFNKEGAMTCKNVIDVRFKQQLNTTFCDEMQKRGWPVERTAAYVPVDTTGMTPEERHAARKQARADAIAERKRRGTWDKSGLNPEQYNKVIRAEKAAEAKEAAASELLDEAKEDRIKASNERKTNFNKHMANNKREGAVYKKEQVVEEKEQKLNAREDSLARRERALNDAYKWMKNTYSLEDTKFDMSIWDFYQEHLGGGKKSNVAKAKTEASKVENVEAKEPEKTVKEQPKMVPQVEEKPVEAVPGVAGKYPELKERYGEEAIAAVVEGYKKSNIGIKKTYSEEDYVRTWIDTADYRQDLDENCREPYSEILDTDRRVPLKNPKLLRQRLSEVIAKYAKKLNFNQLEFGLDVTGLKDVGKTLIEPFREGFKESYNEAMRPTVRERVKRIDDRASQGYDDIEIGVSK